MTWFKVDDHLHASRKAARAGVAAMGLWVLAGSWSAAEELDGFVPSYMVVRLGGTAEMAEALVSAGLWVAQEHDGEDGYRFHQWDEYQPTKRQLDQKREEARERMRRARSRGGDVRANGEGTSPEVTPTPTRPDPTKKNSPSRKRSDSDKAGADFEEFWKRYPKKEGKQSAAKAWLRALERGATVEQLAAGLRNSTSVWTAERREGKFIPHPATWLNQGRWEDEHDQLTLDGPKTLERPRTSSQCSDSQPHGRHPWEDARNRFMCLGVEA